MVDIKLIDNVNDPIRSLSSDQEFLFCGEEYAQHPVTKTFHNIPRFGYSTDVTSVLSTDNDDAMVDYAKGILFIGSFILAFFIAWFVVLLVLKCLGPKRVGFLSGSPFVRCHRHGQDQNDGGNRRPSAVVVKRRIRRSRIFFLCGAILFIVFTLLLATKAVPNLQTTLTTIENANDNTDKILENFDALLTSLFKWVQRAESIRVQAIENLDGICPNLDNDEDVVVDTETDQEIRQQLQEAKDILSDFDGLSSDNIDVQEAKDLILQARTILQQLDDTLNDVGDLNDGRIVAVVVVVLFIASWMIAGLFMTWFGINNKCRERFLAWFIIPILVVIVTIASLGIVGVLSAAIANSDFCSGGNEKTPKETVLKALTATGLKKDDMIFTTVDNYISKCPDNGYGISDDTMKNTTAIGYLQDLQHQLQDAATSIDEVQNAIADVSIARLNLVCGQDFVPTAALLTAIKEVVVALDIHLSSALDSISRPRIVPLYQRTVHNATCEYSIQGFAWAFWSLLVISFGGMLMLTFRSVLWQPQVVDDSETEACNGGNKKLQEDECNSEELTADAPLSVSQLEILSDDEDSILSHMSSSDERLIEGRKAEDAPVDRHGGEMSAECSSMDMIPSSPSKNNDMIPDDENITTLDFAGRSLKFQRLEV